MWQPPLAQQNTSRPAANRNDIQEPKARLTEIKDHGGDSAGVAWFGRNSSYDRNNFPAFGFQLYVLNSAPTTVTDPDLPASLMQWVEQVQGIRHPDMRCHFDIYRGRFDNIVQCMAHQRREVQHRNRNGLWPRLVSSWTTDNERGSRGFILVIDSDEWTSSGLVFADFDRPPYDRDDVFFLTSHLPDGEEFITRARRQRDLSCYGQLFLNYWNAAGHTWTQRELHDRNLGGFSPALYPAVDPTAHHDAEHEDDVDNPQPDVLSQGATTADDSETLHKPIHQFDLLNLWMRPGDLPELKVSVYEDTVDWSIISVWNGSNIKTRPSFSFTMYLAADTPAYFPQALFHCLDWGLLQRSTWALDIVRVPDLESAYYHYIHETPKRSVCETRRRQACARLVLDRVAGSLLPEELIQYIEEMIVPPAHPDYSFLPNRPFPGMFLYLDASSQLAGPSIVYTKVRRNAAVSCEQGDVGRPMSPESDETDELLISKLQHWRLVSDELHTIWSMRSPRADVSSFPQITLHLYFPEVCEYDLRFRPTVENMPNPKLVLTNQSQEPVTIFPIFTPDFWFDALVIDDLTERFRISNLKSSSHNALCPRWHSWLESDLPYAESFAPRTLYPGVEMTLTMQHDGLNRMWWPSHYRAGVFHNGHHYRVRIRDDLRIFRWTFGVLGALKGPFNLPPLPVHTQNESEFLFQVGSVQSWME